jgi:hypothetical protein
MQTKLSQISAYLLPRLQDILFIGILLITAIHGPKLFNQDGDLGRHITIGKYILESRSIPTSDLFSHTMTGQPLVPHEWLAQVILTLAYLAMGLSGDVLLSGLIIALTFLLVYQEIVRRGAFRLAAVFIALWAAAASSLHWLARPHIFTFLFTALWTYSLERVALGKNKTIWQFPLLMLFWANIHGAFISGFVIWGVYFAEWIWKFQSGQSGKEYGVRLALIGAAAFAVTFINPSGWRLWENSIGYIGNNFLVGHTLEYLPPDFQNKSTWPFMFMLAYGLFALSTGKQVRLREAILLAGWAVMSLYSARNIPLFAIITAPIYGELIQHQTRQLPRLAKLDTGLKEIEGQLRGFLWPAAAAALIGFAFWLNIPLDQRQLGNRYDPAVFPVEAMDWLDEHPQQGNMFNHFVWGGYILFREWPKQLVFIDGQTDFYGEALTREYVRVVNLEPGWKNILNKYNVTWALLPADSPLAEALAAQNWHELYGDATAVILKK